MTQKASAADERAARKARRTALEKALTSAETKLEAAERRKAEALAREDVKVSEAQDAVYAVLREAVSEFGSAPRAAGLPRHQRERRAPRCGGRSRGRARRQSVGPASKSSPRRWSVRPNPSRSRAPGHAWRRRHDLVSRSPDGANPGPSSLFYRDYGQSRLTSWSLATRAGYCSAARCQVRRQPTHGVWPSSVSWGCAARQGLQRG